MEYKCTDLYDPTDEVTVAWNDPLIAIAWPIAEPVLSKRDAAALSLAALDGRLPSFDG